MSRYDMFLSYNSRDSGAVGQIAAALKQKGIQSFLDRNALTKGQAWMPEIAEALADTRSVAVFIGSHGLGEFQDQEVQLALQRQSSARSAGAFLPVFAVLLPGAKQADIPAWLTLNTWLDLTSGLSPESLAELADAIHGKTTDRPLPDGGDSGIPWLVWAGVAAAGIALCWFVFLPRPPAAFVGTLAVKWWDPASWSGARWSGTERNSLLVTGETPGLLKMPDSRRLWDSRAHVNLAVKSSQDFATWIVHATDAGRYVRFRYSLPRNGARGVLEGRLVPGNSQPFCSQPVYTEPFGDGHYLFVIVQVSGETVVHSLNLTCPQDDPRCSGSHDPLENRSQEVRCTLPAAAPAYGRFGLMGDGQKGDMEIVEFALEGLRKGATH